jgi:hypothetical protein
MHLNFSEIPLTCEIVTVPWYVVAKEGWLLHYGVNEFLWVFIKHQTMS